MDKPGLPFQQALKFLLLSLVATSVVQFLHPNALNLTRNYFEGSAGTSQVGEFPEHEFQTVSLADTKDWWAYRDDSPGGIYIVDARRSTTFSSGHLPGAWNLDHYADASTWPEGILNRLREASMVVVYCNGGECEDSLLLAHDLVYRHQVPLEIIGIFEAGFEAWEKAEFPIEK
ncbi:MAG: rhodanese-like domain-containing protein [Planctomycetota bacterium]|jgi:rhodanese-related sulfurtransferase|nr:rhodanese-like domain-containing protein [Planctomycetota bacterium]MDP6941508.1 rhodanese-like domain-containing protein [Planctomycetota bacterium]